MEYKNIESLKAAFLSGGINVLPNAIVVSGIKYHTSHGNSYMFDDILTNVKKPMVVYSLDQQLDNKEKYNIAHTSADDENSIQNRIVFVWGAKNLRISPLSVKFVPKQRLASVKIKEADIDDSRIITHMLPIIFDGFYSNKKVDAKVDTGATMSSLHASDIDVNLDSDVVTFVSYGSKITMPLYGTQNIKTADGGTESRPVVEFNITIPSNNNKVIKKIQFNLNDRSNMPDKILLGQNFIKAGNFVVVSNDDKVVDESCIDDEDMLKFEHEMEFSDNIYEYNVENTDALGYDGMPVNAFSGNIMPTIPETPTPPLTPANGDFWFDTSDPNNGLLHRWNGAYWEISQPAYWYDQSTEQLNYRIWYISGGHLTDTNWLPMDAPNAF